MQGRGLTLAAVLLLVILSGTFTVLQQQSQNVLVEAERDRRQLRFTNAAAALSAKARKAEALTRRLAEAEPLRLVSGDELGGTRVEASRALHTLMVELVRGEPAITRLRVLKGGVALAGYAVVGVEPSPLVAAKVLDGVLAQAADDPGTVALGLVEVEGKATLQAAIRTGLGVLVLVEVDAAVAVEACAGAAAPGRWALVEGDTVLWPLGVTAPAAPTEEGRTTVEGHEIAAAPKVPYTNWILRARVPLSDEVGANRLPFLLAALSAALVVWLGARGARAVALQETIEETARNERQLQAIFDAIADVFVVVDTELEIVRANRVAKEAYGKDLIGRSYADAIAAVRSTDPLEELSALRRIVTTGQHRSVELVTARGRVWQVAQYPIFTEGLTVRGVVEHARDVTQNRLLQSQLVQSEKLSTLGEMAAGIAHEINNPIGVVSMFAQLLAEEIKVTLGEDSDALEKVTMIEEQASNVGEIVKGLLRFARKSEGEKVRFTARSAIERAVTIVSHQKILEGVELVRELPEEPAALVGDEGQLAQVILNLIVNACHAMDHRRQLTLRVARRGPDGAPPPGRPFGQTDGSPSRIDITVTDTGAGIDPEALERIFEPFFTTKPAGEGTGLGLSVGFGIIRDHGGCIWVGSEPGKGTTFTLDLPAAVVGEGATPSGDGGESRA